MEDRDCCQLMGLATTVQLCHGPFTGSSRFPLQLHHTSPNFWDRMFLSLSLEPWARVSTRGTLSPWSGRAQPAVGQGVGDTHQFHL